MLKWLAACAGALLFSCTLTRNPWLSIWARRATVQYVSMMVVEQPAPTIHQSLIWNNSTADSSHKIPSRWFLCQIMALIWALCPAHTQTHTHTHTDNWLTCSTPASQLHLMCMCVWADVCACLSQLLLFLCCASLGEDWQGVSMAERDEALMWRTWECFENKECLCASLKSYTGRKSDRPRDELWILHV